MVALFHSNDHRAGTGACPYERRSVYQNGRPETMRAFPDHVSFQSGRSFGTIVTISPGRVREEHVAADREDSEMESQGFLEEMDDGTR